MTADQPLRAAINELTFALDEIETHWDAMESLLRAHLELVKSQPTDPRILSGDYTKEEIGDDTSYIQHEINALVKNRDLIREKHRLLLQADLMANPTSVYSCCPGEHTFDKTCLAPSPCSDPGCPEKQKVCDRCRPSPVRACTHEVCSCVCHLPGDIILHDRSCCDVCRQCGLRAVIIYKSL